MNTNIMYNRSEYTVTGTNLNWVRDIKEPIKEVFEKYGTKKDFFHSRKSWIVWILLGFSLALLYRYYLPSDTISETIQVSIWTPTLSFYLWLLFAWLFPRIETKYMLQTKVRKWVLIGLLGIPFSVLGNYIWSLFQR